MHSKVNNPEYFDHVKKNLNFYSLKQFNKIDTIKISDKKMKNDFSSILYNVAKKYDNFWVVTVVHTSGSTPRKVGAKMIVNSKGRLVWGTIGGGNIEKIASQTCRKLQEAKLISYNTGEDETINESKEITGMICGGSMTLFYEPYGKFTKPTVWIYGAGHIGKAIYNLLVLQDWNIIMLDDRKDVLTEEDFPDAERRLGLFDELVKFAEYSKNDYIIIVTAGHKSDKLILQKSLEKKLKYLGMMGSEKKIKEIFDKLRERGVSEELLQQVNSPIGLSIVGESPEEIAVDIVAKLLKVRYSD